MIFVADYWAEFNLVGRILLGIAAAVLFLLNAFVLTPRLIRKYTVINHVIHINFLPFNNSNVQHIDPDEERLQSHREGCAPSAQKDSLYTCQVLPSLKINSQGGRQRIEPCAQAEAFPRKTNR